jgi:DNA-binding transcriptional regulator YiaG
MANVITALKAEIARIARREIRQTVVPLHKPVVAARHAMADLKRRVAALEKDNQRLAALLSKVPEPASAEEPAKVKGWISGKGILGLRRKLGLSQDAFAKLVGVSPNAVYQWERKSGMLRLRAKTQAAVMAARELGAREAKAKLAAKTATRKAKSAGKAKK